MRSRDPIINLRFTDELRGEQKQVASLGGQAVKSKLQEDWDEFHRAQRVYSSNLRWAARVCYQKFATDLPDLADMAKFFRMVRSQPRHDIGVMRAIIFSSKIVQ